MDTGACIMQCHFLEKASSKSEFVFNVSSASLATSPAVYLARARLGIAVAQGSGGCFQSSPSSSPLGADQVLILVFASLSFILSILQYPSCFCLLILLGSRPHWCHCLQSLPRSQNFSIHDCSVVLHRSLCHSPDTVSSWRVGWSYVLYLFIDCQSSWHTADASCRNFLADWNAPRCCSICSPVRDLETRALMHPVRWLLGCKNTVTPVLLCVNVCVLCKDTNFAGEMR